MGRQARPGATRAGSTITHHKSQNEGREGCPGSETQGRWPPQTHRAGQRLKTKLRGTRLGQSPHRPQGTDCPTRQSIAGQGCWSSLLGAPGKRRKRGLAPVTGHRALTSGSGVASGSPRGILVLWPLATLFPFEISCAYVGAWGSSLRGRKGESKRLRST